MEDQRTTSGKKEKFIPRGSIVFFFMLMVFFIVLWGLMYWLMIART